MKDRSLRDARTNKSGSLAFGSKDCRDGVAAAFANDHHDLALTVLVTGKAALNALCLLIGGLHVAAEIATIHLSHLAFAADHTAAHFLSHRFAQLVQKHERGLVREAQVALHLVAERQWPPDSPAGAACGLPAPAP